MFDIPAVLFLRLIVSFDLFDIDSHINLSVLQGNSTVVVLYSNLKFTLSLIFCAES
jgi:hypothetical protein